LRSIEIIFQMEKEMNNGISFAYLYFSDSFLHTTLTHTTLTGFVYQFNNICIQLLIGLCATCEIYIRLYDRTGVTELKNVLIKSSLKGTSHGLPTWQSVTIEHSMDNYDNAIMKLTTKLNSYNSNPLWAVANVRLCPSTNFNIFIFQCLSLHLNQSHSSYMKWFGHILMINE